MAEESPRVTPEDQPLDDLDELTDENVQLISTIDPSTQTGLLSLPIELLLRVFGSLNDKELYKHIGTCRILHDVALSILLSRRCNKILSGKAYFHNPPFFLLPAVHGALFLDDLHNITIMFSPDSYKFLEEVRVLTEIIERMRRNTRLYLNMKKVDMVANFADDKQVNPSSRHRERVCALQRLMDAALKKGCTALSVFSPEPYKLYLPQAPVRVTPFQSQEEHKKVGPLSGFVQRLKRVFDKPRPPVHAAEISQEEENPAATTSSPSIKSTDLGMVPIFPSHLDMFPSADRAASITISSALLFAPFFLDWTLSLLNYGKFTKLNLVTTHFNHDICHEILPKIYMDSLTDFSFNGDTATPDDLVMFLQRHSYTIECISSLSRYFHPHIKWIEPNFAVKVSTPELRDSSLPPPSYNLALHVDPLYLDFPNIRHLTLNSFYLPWFLDGIMSNPNPTECLPNLSILAVKVIFQVDRPYVPNLDQALDSILRLTLLKNHEHCAPSWLSCLRINAKDVEPSLFLSWLDAYTTKYCPTEEAVVQAMQFSNIQDLRLDFRHMPANFEILNPIRRFLVLFPNVRRFDLGSISKDALKKRRGGYWQSIKVHCPQLDMVVFDDARQLRAKMNDLVDGKYPF